jgi:hypothetical protein
VVLAHFLLPMNINNLNFNLFLSLSTFINTFKSVCENLWKIVWHIYELVQIQKIFINIWFGGYLNLQKEIFDKSTDNFLFANEHKSF